MTGLLDKIRSITGDFYLGRESAKERRKKQLVNLSTAKKIGLIYRLDDDATYSEISRFVHELQADNKSVKAMGYVKDKYLTQRYLPKISFDFFYEKDLNWYKRPGGNYVKDFLQEPFDLFIDLSLEEEFPIKYISSRVKAKFKVGKYSDSYEPIFDLLIKMDDNAELNKFIEQVRHYLTILNPRSNVKQN